MDFISFTVSDINLISTGNIVAVSSAVVVVDVVLLVAVIAYLYWDGKRLSTMTLA